MTDNIPLTDAPRALRAHGLSTTYQRLWGAKRGQKEVTDMRIIIACPDAPRIERAWRGCPGLTNFPFDRHIIRD